MLTDQDLYEEINIFLLVVIKIIIDLSGSFCTLPVYACAYLIVSKL